MSWYRKKIEEVPPQEWFEEERLDVSYMVKYPDYSSRYSDDPGYMWPLAMMQIKDVMNHLINLYHKWPDDEILEMCHKVYPVWITVPELKRRYGKWKSYFLLETGRGITELQNIFIQYKKDWIVRDPFEELASIQPFLDWVNLDAIDLVERARQYALGNNLGITVDDRWFDVPLPDGSWLKVRDIHDNMGLPAQHIPNRITELSYKMQDKAIENIIEQESKII